MCRIRCVVVCVTVAASILAVPGYSHAEDDRLNAIVFGAIVGGASGIGGIITDIGLAVKVSEGWSAGKDWEVAWFVLGGLSIAAGVWLSAWLSYSEEKMWLGLPNLVIGGSNIIMASISLHRPAKPETEWALTPIVAPDGQGGYYTGVGVNVVGW